MFFNGEDGLTVHTDERVAFHHDYAGLTPAMATPRIGTGSEYDITYLDIIGRPFDGSKA